MNDMPPIIFATNNIGKIKEIKEIFADLGVPVIPMGEAGIGLDVEENGATFSENAIIKARAVRAVAPSGALVLADDSGLEIDHLDKAPGVHSARFMGADTSYRIKNGELIKQLRGVPDEKRTARFVCAIAAILPDGSLLTCEESFAGRIAHEESGANGFGYDPIFYLPEYGMTSAALPRELKNELSHRGKALRAMHAMLKQAL